MSHEKGISGHVWRHRHFEIIYIHTVDNLSDVGGQNTSKAQHVVDAGLEIG